MTQILVRNLNDDCISALKHVAKQHGRSLQAEIKQILELTAATAMYNHAKAAAKIKNKLRGRQHTDSVKLLSEDRKR